MLAQNSSNSSGEGRAQIFPVVAAHQHLMSPAGVALVPPEPPLATIQLPPDLDQLLRRREKVSGAPPTGDLFTEDAIIQEIQEGRWIVGRDRIDNFLGFMEKDLHYVPSAYSAEGSTGWIAGTVRQGTATKEVLNFVLGLKKRPGGTWQIATEIFTVIPAPTVVTGATPSYGRLPELLPSMHALHASYYAVYELLGEAVRRARSY